MAMEKNDSERGIDSVWRRWDDPESADRVHGFFLVRNQIANHLFYLFIHQNRQYSTSGPKKSRKFSLRPCIRGLGRDHLGCWTRKSYPYWGYITVGNCIRMRILPFNWQFTCKVMLIIVISMQLPSAQHFRWFCGLQYLHYTHRNF